MSDNEFKHLSHCAKDYTVNTNGKAIEKNYSPDISLINGNKYILIEHESQPNRKTILADILKAAHFLQKEKNGILVIVLTPKGKSSFESYIKHSTPYFNWIREFTCLSDVFFILERDYSKNELGLEIFNNEFMELAVSVRNSL